MSDADLVHVNPKGPPPKPKNAAPPEDPSVVEQRVKEAEERLAREKETQFKAKKAADEAARSKASADQLALAKGLMRVATPADPIALRRVELKSAADTRLISEHATPTTLIDLVNVAWREYTLLFDGTVVHAIHARDTAAKSFWIPLGNVAAMYPRID